MSAIDHKPERVRAQAKREAIARLRKSADWTDYYAKRLQQRLEEARERVLHDASVDTPEKLWQARLVYQERREIAGLLESDETAAERIIGKNTDASEL